MGSHGVDVILSPTARKIFPFSIEAKNQEKYGQLYKDFDQAVTNTKAGTYPMMVIKVNNKPPVVVLELDTFLGMLYGRPSATE